MAMKNQWLVSAVLSTLLAGSVGVGCSKSNEQNKDLAPVEQESSDKEKVEKAEPEKQEFRKGSLAAPGTIVQSKMLRDSAPEVSKVDADKFSHDNRAFAFDLYHTLRAEQPDQNLFVSPHSISSAVAMAYAGARGETATEIAQAMHFTLAPHTLHPAFNSLHRKLAERPNIEVQDGGGLPFLLEVVNAIWGQNDHPFSAEYLDVLAKNYGAGLHQMDFSGNAEESRKEINHWIEEKTKARIKNLIPQGAIDSDTRLVLTNAIYFRAGWLQKFQKSFTDTAPFHLMDGSTAEVKLMRQMAHFPYAEDKNYQMIELPYMGNEVAMLVVLPARGEFEAFEKALTGEEFVKMVGKLESKNGNIHLPKFSFESSFSLEEPLGKLGMNQAFSRDADFSGMDGAKDLSIGAVVHKAFVAVDEEGTEAAAATAIMMGTTSMPVVDFEMSVDRPFVFVIYDKPTQTVLFVGRVVDPS